MWRFTVFAAVRDLFRQWPEARESFAGDRRWLQFSRRFGLRYAIPALLAPFVWIVVSPKFIPDTELGAWLIFGPALASIFVGVILGGLVVARWMVDER